MEENKTPKVVSILCDMESNLYLMTRAIHELDDRIDSLGHKGMIRQPMLNKAKKPFHDGEEERGLFLIIGAIFSFVIAFLVSFVGYFMEHSGELWEIIANIIASIVGGLFYALLGSGAGFLVYYLLRIFVIPFLDRRKMRQTQEIYDREYANQCAAYQRALDADRRRVEQELMQKQSLCAERNRLIARKAESEAALRRFYEMAHIAPRFRNIVAISCMDEYVKLNISTKLDGTDGLYYLVMQELDKLKLWTFLEGISGKLDAIIDRLDDIAGKVDALNERLRMLNHRCDQLLLLSVNHNALLEKIQNNTALVAYHQERIAKEAEYQSVLMTYSVVKDAVKK